MLERIGESIALTTMSDVVMRFPCSAWLVRWADGETIELCVGMEALGKQLKIALAPDEAYHLGTLLMEAAINSKGRLS